ncbi:MAG: hypothetical protein JRE23_00655 [Deltaproteobacteria bacterium]|nr:hypothetical protein [Deltaproteobacteria bacterium]
MITDTTFFTNEPGYALLDRFKKTLEHVQYYETEIGIRKFLEFLTADCTNKEQDIANGGNGKKMELRAENSTSN